MPFLYLLEQTTGDVTPGDDWLDACELKVQSTLRFEKRRCDWRLGRWTAKKLIARYMGVPPHTGSLAAIRIESEPGGAPVAVFAGGGALPSISISHSSGSALCALTSSAIRLGCDLEQIQTRAASFLADYFTNREQGLVEETCESGRALVSTLLWSAKESTLKAMGVGLRLDTRSVDVDASSVAGTPEGRWSPLVACSRDSGRWRGWWSFRDGFVRTVVVGTSAISPSTGAADQAEKTASGSPRLCCP